MCSGDIDFDPDSDIPVLTGKVIVVTGANTGIGYETAKRLASRGARVYLACRSAARARRAIRDIAEELGRDASAEKRALALEWLPLDLSTIHGAKKAADEFLSREKRLDVLINNAASLSTKYELNEDGFETTMAVNYVGHFTFTLYLLPLLVQTASVPGSDVRIVSLTSALHAYIPSKTVLRSQADLNATMERFLSCKDSTLSCFRRYCLSKLAIILFTRALQRRLEDHSLPNPILVTCVHPGMVSTSNMKSHVPTIIRPLLPLVSLTPARGCRTILIAAVAPAVRRQSRRFAGQYLVPFGKLGKVGKAATGVDGEELFRVTEKIVKDTLQASGDSRP